MKAPTTLPEALAEIEGLRSQVHDLLQLLRQGAQPIAAGVNPSPAGITGAYEFSEGLVPNQAEKEAAQHLRDLHQMIETVPDVIFKLNLEGNLTGWNKRLAIVTGFSAQELNGRPALAFVPVHEHGQTAAAIQRAFEDGYAELEGHLLTKDGRAIPYHWTGAALKDEQGLTIGITGVGRDISERTKTEAQLREMNLALSQAMQGIARLDLNGRYVEMNDLYASMLGYLPTELIGQPWEPTVHPEDRYLVHAAFEDMQKSGRGECEARATRKDGSVFWKHVFLVRGVHEATPSDHHCLMREVTDRKQAESALRQSEAHFRALIEQSSDIITVLDPDGTVRFESPSFERLLGYKQHELDGQIAFDFIHPDDLQTVLEKFQLVVQCPDLAQTAEFRFRHRDGSWLALEGIGRSVVDADGQCLVIVNSRDVTERKRAENALSRSYDLLKSFVEHTPAAVAMLDKDLRYIAVSRRWYQDYRLGNQDLIGRHHYDVFPEIRSIAEWQTIHRRCLGGAVERREEDRFVRADGSEDWLRWEVRPWHDETDHIGGLIMFTEVITERKQAEQALADSEARFRTVVEGTSDWMWETDAQGRYTYSSPRVRDLLGYEPEEILGKTPFDFMLPEEAERVGLLFSSIVEARSAFDRLENTQRHKDGHLVVLECRGVPILDADGTLRGYRGFDRDVTIQKQAEQALRASEERYARATAVGKVGVWELDAVTGLYHSDVNLKALFGYEPDELSTDPYVWLGLVHPEDQSIALKAWEGIISGSTDDYYYELRMIRKDGTIIWTDVRGHAERDKHGRLQRLIGATVDITERKQAISALQISQLTLQQTLQASNTGLWDWNIETNEVRLSREWKRQLGYEEAELPDTFESWESRLHPDDRDRAVAYAMRYRDNPAGPFRLDFRMLHKDGTYRWIDSQASFVTEADGRRVRLLGSHTDITERKQAEATLTESEARFRTLVANIPGAIYRCAVDKEWTMSYLSHAIEEIVGYPAAEFIGNHTRSYASVIHPDDRQLVQEATGASLRERRPYVLEYRLIHANGEVRWVYEKGQGVFTPDGEVRFLDGAIFDITDRKRVEETLRLTQFSIDRAVDGVFWVAPDARILSVNEAACRMLEYSRKELTTMTVHDIDPNFPPEAWPAHWEELKRKGSMTFESRHWSSTGRVLDTEVTENYLLYEDLEYNCTIVRDIGERKRAEEALRQSEARLNEAQRIAHIGSWELDLTTNWLDWSDEIYRIFELDRERFGACYEAFLALIHPDDRSAVDRAYTDSVRNCTPYEITHRLLMPDGRVKYVHEQCETIYDAAGQPQRSLGTVQDVTEEMQLAEREADRLKQLQTLSELGLTLSGDPGEIFERVVRMIGELFHVRVVCLSEIVGDDLQFKAVYSNGEVVRDAGRCPLIVTPCATVERDKALCLFDRVMEQFPEATFLRNHQAVSYCGFPALDRHGRVVAVTCLLDDRPHEFTTEEQALLRVFGQRIAMELERARYLADQTRHAEEQERAHVLIRQIIDTDPNFIFAKDRDGRFLLANKAVAEAYGTTVDGLIGKTDADFNPNRDEVEFFAQKDLEVLDSLQERFIPEEKITDAAGHVRWLQTVKRPLLDDTGRVTMVLGASTDITARKDMELALRRRESDLRAAMAERERISEDLHDGILQSIYAVGLGLEACKPLIAKQPKRSAVKLKTELQRTIGQLNHVLEEVRNFITGLESHILDGQEFDAVLRTMVQTLATSYSVPCRVTVEKAAAQRLSTEQAYHVMNVAREALSNSFRHSHARKIALSLKCLRRSVRLSVVDDGVGFNPSAVRDTGHGLANMESRASKLGGTFTLRSKPRGGTRIILDLPMRWTDADD